MDSPISHSQGRQFKDDEPDHALVSLSNWARSIKPSRKVVSVLVVSLVLGALGFSSLPLWRPMGALVLHKLWDVLRFLVITSSIGLGILSSRQRRGTGAQAESAALNSGDSEDSLSSKVPFVGMFYGGEVQHSFSFSDKDEEPDEGVLKTRSESQRDAGLGTNAALLTDKEHNAPSIDGKPNDKSLATSTDGSYGDGPLRATNDQRPQTQQAAILVNGPTMAVSIRRGIAQKGDAISADYISHRHDKEDGGANEDASTHPPVHVRPNTVVEVSKRKKRSVKLYDDIGLAAVAQQQPKQSGSKIIHRRGNSLEFPAAQEWGSVSRQNGAATSHRSATHGKPASSEKAMPSNVAVCVNKKETEPSGSISAAGQAKHCNIDGGVSSSASKHSRSQSAYSLNELLVQQRPRSKPSSSSQLSRRRNVSLSCDLDKECATGGPVAWLSSLPSPPEPPLIYGYDIVGSGLVSADVDVSKQEESSLRKAFSESLAPWRAAINTVPINIPKVTDKEANQSKQDPSAKTRKNSAMANEMVSSLSCSPAPASPMASPSPRELNKKVDAFITRFHQRIRLQRLESLERSKQRGL